MKRIREPTAKNLWTKKWREATMKDFVTCWSKLKIDYVYRKEAKSGPVACIVAYLR